MSQLQVTGEAKIRDIQGPVVANSGVITALDGAASQYVRGDGTLADFPTSSGGGSSVSYYLNSSVSQGTIGGVAYRELSKDPIIGAGTDITISANGYVANYITDANDPDVTIVPGGNFNCEFYFSVNNNTGNPTTYAELYKYDGTTFTLLGTSAGVPESINQGTTIAPYYFAIPVATASLSVTDRLAIRIYVNVSGRTVTLHTENGHLCQVVTTLSKGMVSLNNLTDQSQYLATGTSGTNFNIVSSGDTHTFNLPVASATNTGKLSSTDWSTFNNKVPYTGAIANVDLGNFNFDANNISGAAIIAKLNGPASSPFVLKSGSSGYTIGDDAISLISSPNVANTLILASNIGVVTKTAQFGLGSLTTTRTYTLPDASGTIALTSDINYPVTSVFGRTGAVVAQSGDYTTTQVTEGTNLYYTDSRSRGALSFTAGSGAYNSSTGVITIPTNNNQITNGAGYITSSALSGYLPLTGGTLTGGLNGTTATFSGLGTFYQLTMTGATAGRIFYAQTGGVVSQSGNLNWNETNGMLGVGTPNPTAVITAFSNSAATQFKAAGTAPAFTFSESLTTSTRACVFGLATAANQFITGTAAGDMAIANQSTVAGAIVFGTGTTERMRMSSSGNFGIGTGSPLSKLHVNTGTNQNFRVRPGTDVGATNGVAINSRTDDDGSLQQLTLRASDVIMLTSGNVGIGTSSPTGTYGKLSVAGGISILDDNNAKLEIGRYSSGASNSYIKLGANSNSLRITNNNDTADIFTITNSGNVGIGTSSPSARLTVATSNGETIRMIGQDTIGDNYMTFYNTSGTRIGYIGYGYSNSNIMEMNQEANDPILFSTNNAERMRITSGGNVLIGTTTDSAGVRLKVAGGIIGCLDVYNNTTGVGANVNIDANGFFARSTSSIKYKKNVENYTKGLTEVMQMRPVTYNSINETETQTYAGLIAEEIHDLGLTEFVQYAEDGTPDALSYGNMVALLVKSIQELEARIKQLENK